MTKTLTTELPSLNRHARRREKVFGAGKPRPMSRDMKQRLTRLARVLMRPTEPGKHYGKITAKHFEVFRVLQWEFHNAITGLCFPSYEAIVAKVAETGTRVARSTVAEAIKALEAAGLLTWVNRIKRAVKDGRLRVERTSNGYRFADPPDVQSSKSENKPGTEGQELFSSVAAPAPAPKPVDSALAAALARLGSAISDRRLVGA